MSDVETVVRRWWTEVLGDGNLDVIAEIVRPTFVRHDRNGTRVLTREQLRGEVAQQVRAIQGSRTTFDDLAVAGDKMWARVTARGVNLESVREVTLTWIGCYRAEEGQLAESWGLYQVEVDWTS